MDRRKLLKLVFTAAAVVAGDQVTKAAVLHLLPLHADIAVIPGFFNITHVMNPGGAFGFLAKAHEQVRQLMFLGVSFCALALVFYLYWTTPDRFKWLAAAFGLIFGGAVGNLIDRLRFGAVVDFLDIYVHQWHWPAFNVADSAITVGVSIFLFHLVFGRMPDSADVEFRGKSKKDP